MSKREACPTAGADVVHDTRAPEDMAALRLTMAPMAPHRASLKEITGKQALAHANFGSVDVGRFRRYT